MDLLRRSWRAIRRGRSTAENAQAYQALAVAALRRGDISRALEHTEAARQAAPLDPDIAYQWALTQHVAGQLQSAAQGYALVIELDRNHVWARGNLGSMRLASGDYSREAWSLYLANLERRGEDGRDTALPAWEGEDVYDQTVLAFGHHALGDQIMFGSCLLDLAPRVGRLIVCLDSRIVGLFARALPQAQVKPMTYVETRGWEREGVTVHFCTPLARLAREYRTNRADFPRRNHYLQAEPARMARWRRRLDALGPGAKVGISWRGGTPQTRREQRSIPLPKLKPVFDTPGVHFVSLQYGEVGAELDAWRRETGIVLHHWPEAIMDYEETAALACSLDHVVSVTTSLVHLCGALGVGVSVLVDTDAQWRYGTSGETMPWYPSVRLHRQSAPDDWSEPVAAAAARIHGLAC